MADKSDKGTKKNDTGKKNQPEIRSDSSTFSYEVPIPGAAPETIKMTNSAGVFQTSGNAQTWGQEHIQRSILQLEQIVITLRNI
jgi:hypothetical protein